LATARLLVVATVSSERGVEALEALAGLGRTIQLGPLSAAEVAELAARMLYETIPEPVRVSRHRRAAVLLAGAPETVASHHAAAGDWAAAASAWSAAAERAMLAFALRDAERLFGEALDAATATGEREQVAELRLRRGQVREELADYDGARDDHVAALELARALGDPRLEARALERLGWTAYYTRDTDAASEFAARATELAEEAAAAPAALPSALLLAGRLRHWDGDLTGASTAYQEALAADSDPATAATALGFLGALLEHSDRFDDARRVLGQAITACQRTGALRPLLLSMFFSGMAKANLGDLGGALRALERMQRLLEEYDLAYYRAGVQTTLAWVWRELSELGRPTTWPSRRWRRLGRAAACSSWSKCCTPSSRSRTPACWTATRRRPRRWRRRQPQCWAGSCRSTPEPSCATLRSAPGWNQTVPNTSLSWHAAGNPPNTRHSHSAASARPTRPSASPCRPGQTCCWPRWHRLGGPKWRSTASPSPSRRNCGQDMPATVASLDSSRPAPDNLRRTVDRPAL
jgi:tetratricopeptide (TPR) repeat protein